MKKYDLFRGEVPHQEGGGRARHSSSAHTLRLEESPRHLAKGSRRGLRERGLPRRLPAPRALLECIGSVFGFLNTDRSHRAMIKRTVRSGFHATVSWGHSQKINLTLSDRGERSAISGVLLLEPISDLNHSGDGLSSVEVLGDLAHRQADWVIELSEGLPARAAILFRLA